MLSKIRNYTFSVKVSMTLTNENGEVVVSAPEKTFTSTLCESNQFYIRKLKNFVANRTGISNLADSTRKLFGEIVETASAILDERDIRKKKKFARENPEPEPEKTQVLDIEPTPAPAPEPEPEKPLRKRTRKAPVKK